jgi:hypothetical protein
MKAKYLLFTAVFILLYFIANSQSPGSYTLVVHGGAGNITPTNLPAEKAKQFEAKLRYSSNSLLNFTKH